LTCIARPGANGPGDATGSHGSNIRLGLVSISCAPETVFTDGSGSRIRLKSKK